jgi:hypothetical protein
MDSSRFVIERRDVGAVLRDHMRQHSALGAGLGDMRRGRAQGWGHGQQGAAVALGWEHGDDARKRATEGQWHCCRADDVRQGCTACCSRADG